MKCNMKVIKFSDLNIRQLKRLISKYNNILKIDKYMHLPKYKLIELLKNNPNITIIKKNETLIKNEYDK